MTHRARILVVDDEPRWLASLSHVLKTAGYDVDFASSGEIALASVAAGEPDLVLLDIRMPGMDGFEVLQRLNDGETSREIPIVLLSAFAEVNERIEGFKLGAADFITKPFHAGELLARVQMQVEIVRLRGEHESQTAALRTANKELQSEIIERKAAEARIARLTQLYAALSQCSQAIVHSSGAEDLFQQICRNVVQIGGMKMAWVGLVDGSGRVLLAASYGEGTDYLKTMNVSTSAQDATGRGPVGTSIREGMPVWCQDFQGDPSTTPWHKEGAFYGWGSAASLPLHLREQTIGAFVVYGDKTHAFDSEVRKLLVEMANDISFALECFAREADRKKTEETLKERERDLLRAQAIAHLGSWSWDIALNQFSWSEEMFRIYGVDPATFDGTVEGAARLIHPEDLWKQERAIGEWLAGEAGEVFDYRVIRADGTERVAEVSSVQIDFDSEGRPRRVFGVVQDVTERKKAELALRESEERFRLMLQHIPSISVQGYRMDGTTQYWNDASEVLYGYPAEEAIGRNLLDLIVPLEMREGVREAICSMARTLVPVPAGELTLLRKDGSRVTVYSSHTVVRRRELEPEMFCIDIDLTDRKRAEESLQELNRNLEATRASAEELAIKAQAAARTKSDFLAMMSHELRTPLNGVLGFAELLAGTNLDAEQSEYARTIIESGSHLLDVVNDILDFSSIEQGKLVIDPSPFLLSDLLQSSCSPTRRSLIDKGIEFRCEMEPGVPERIIGDIRRIRQILINLLGNAVKFTAGGSVILRVAPAIAGGWPVLNFSVEDTGPGIPPEKLACLFEPFMQADTTLRRGFEGAGLGLAISRRLAGAMGGAITVDSVVGRGSTFTFRLPLHPDSSAPTVSWDAGTRQISVLSSSDRDPVLVVEDDLANSILAGKMLASLGHRVEFAGNGLEAVEAFARQKFCAILMDMQMPVMDGIEAARKIREHEAGSGGHVPIIALTANVMRGDRESCLEAGMDEFLSKPFKKGELFDKLALFTQP